MLPKIPAICEAIKTLLAPLGQALGLDETNIDHAFGEAATL